jgi:hypothetical protein
MGNIYDFYNPVYEVKIKTNNRIYKRIEGGRLDIVIKRIDKLVEHKGSMLGIKENIVEIVYKKIA